jgi:hypothetical protein
MSRARDLRESPDFNMNMYDLMSIFVPEKKSKYVETLMRIMKNTQNLDQNVKEIKKELIKTFDLNSDVLDNFTNMQLIMGYNFIESMFNNEDLKIFQKFCELNERNIVAENDLSKYKTFQQIIDSVDIAQLILDEKEMEKQIKIVLKTDDWLVLRPLTFTASRKYGANTKWCTTSEKDDQYFMKYAGNGVLCYVINRKTNMKVASFFSLKKDNPEFSFWNVQDKQIDSLQTELPREILDIIVNENIEKRSNLDLLNEDNFGLNSTLKKLQNRITGAISREYHTSNTEPIQERDVDGMGLRELSRLELEDPLLETEQPIEVETRVGNLRSLPIGLEREWAQYHSHNTPVSDDTDGR